MSYVDPRTYAREAQTRQSQQFIFAGAAAGGFIAVFVGLAGDVPFWFTVLTLPFGGALVGWNVSPEARAIREDRKAETERLRREERINQGSPSGGVRSNAPLTPVQRDAVNSQLQRWLHAQREAASQGSRQPVTAAEEQAKWEELVEHERKNTETAWWRRAHEALMWWVSTGRRFHTNPDFREDFVRLSAEAVVQRYANIHNAFINPDDLCATPERTEAIAQWALTHRSAQIAEELREPLPSGPDQAQRFIKRILWLHHRREIDIYPEAKALLDARGIRSLPPLRGDETIEQRWRRSIKDFDAILAFQIEARSEIEERAGQISDADERNEYTRSRLEYLNDLIAHELKRRTGLYEETPAPESRGWQ